MAVAATATRANPTDRSASLRMGKMTSLRGLMLGAGVLGSAPNIADSRPSEPITDLANYSQDETFRRNFQQNQIQRQIGNQLGIDARSPGKNEDDNAIEAAARETSEEQANILYNNQRGQDGRSANAARGSLNAAMERGQQQILQSVTDAGRKEIQKLGVSLGNEALAATFSEGADMGISDILTTAHDGARAVITILVPEQKSPSEIKNLADVQSALFNESINTFFPRYNLYTMSGLSGLIGFIIQFLIISLVLLCLIGAFVLLLKVMDMVGQPIQNCFLQDFSCVRNNYANIMAAIGI